MKQDGRPLVAPTDPVAYIDEELAGGMYAAPTKIVPTEGRYAQASRRSLFDLRRPLQHNLQPQGNTDKKAEGTVLPSAAFDAVINSKS